MQQTDKKWRKLNSQQGALLSLHLSLSFKVPYHLFPHPFIFLWIYNPPETFDYHSLTTLLNYSRSVKRLHKPAEFAGRCCLCARPIDVTHWLGVLAPGRDQTNGADTTQGRESRKNNWKLHQQRPLKKRKKRKDSEKNNCILKAQEQKQQKVSGRGQSSRTKSQNQTAKQ